MSQFATIRPLLLARQLMRKLAVLLPLIFAMTLVSAPVANASGLTAVQVQAIVGLLQSFGADSSVIANVQATLNGQPTTGTSASCVNLTANLYAGQTDDATGGQVTQLQNFLGVSPATGYFGPATLQAVQDWQAAHGVVSNGNADTTGYGFVGPKTRTAMGCGGSHPAVPTTNPSLSVTDVSGYTVTVAYAAMPANVDVYLADEDGHSVWSASLTPDGSMTPSGTKTFTLPNTVPARSYSLVANNAKGILVQSSTFLLGTAPAATSVSLDQSSLTTGSSNPVITGSAHGLSEFTIDLTGGSCNSGGWVSVTNGHWSWPAGGTALNLAPGTCTVTVRATQSSPVLTTGTLVVRSSAATQTVIVAIDQNSLTTTSANPVISGSATGLTAITVSVADEAPVGGSASVTIPVVNGNWSVSVDVLHFPTGGGLFAQSPAGPILANGSYQVSLYRSPARGESNLLARAELHVSASTATPASTVSAAIDQSSLAVTSGNSRITGTLSGTSQVCVYVGSATVPARWSGSAPGAVVQYCANGVYGAPVSASGGSWSVQVSTNNLENGESYRVGVYDNAATPNNGTLLASSSFVFHGSN